MSDFSPVTMFFILYESLGVWLWLLLGLALVLLTGTVASALKLRRVGAVMKRPLIAAAIIGVAVAVATTFVVPNWTLTDTGALSAPVDYIVAFLFALVPGAIVAALIFIIVASRYKAAGTSAV